MECTKLKTFGNYVVATAIVPMMYVAYLCMFALTCVYTAAIYMVIYASNLNWYL